MEEKTQPRLLLVDDEKSILDSLYRFCRQRKWKALRANSGAEGLELLKENSIDLIISDMRMPNMDGAEFLTKAREISPMSMRVLLTGYADIDAVANAVNEAKIYNYLSKPWDEGMLENVIKGGLAFKKSEEERIQLERELAEKKQELEMINLSLEGRVEERTRELEEAMKKIQENNRRVSNNFKECLSLINNVISMQDGTMADYSTMVVSASVSIASTIGLSPKEIEQIRIAAQLHNLGKLSLPDTIRKRPLSTLTNNEIVFFKKHSIQGETVLSGMTGLKTVSKIIRSHQEYMDGSGFPDKLKDNAIPIGSRIICVASDFQKLACGLLAKNIHDNEKAMEYIETNSGRLYDSRVVELFKRYHEEHLKNYHSHVKHLPLSEIEVGMLLAENLLSEKGTLLLTQETAISDDNIRQLNKYEQDMGSKLIFPIINVTNQEDKKIASP